MLRMSELSPRLNTPVISQLQVNVTGIPLFLFPLTITHTTRQTGLIVTRQFGVGL